MMWLWIFIAFRNHLAINRITFQKSLRDDHGRRAPYVRVRVGAHRGGAVHGLPPEKEEAAAVAHVDDGRHAVPHGARENLRCVSAGRFHHRACGPPSHPARG